MTTPFSAAPGPAPVRKGVLGLTLLAALGALPAPAALAQAPAAPAAPAATTVAPTDDPQALVGRIALYPDDLIAIILPASTNPLQIVQAERFLAKRKADPKTPVDEKWDDSIKSLVNYPEVVAMMSGDLDWTAALGEAVVADQGAVLEGIQAFRRKTQAAGNLKSDQKQTIVVEKEVITIVPADPQVIYVPQYNPTTVVVSGGYVGYGYYPSPYPVYYYPYPPGAAFATGLVWGAAMGAVWHGGRYATHYGGDANININRNTTINTGNINTGNINTGNIGSGNRATQNTANSTKWSSSKQKGQVSKSVGASPPSRAGDARAGGGAAAGSMDRGGGSRGGATASTGTGDRGGTGGGSAFDGYGSGRSAQMDSSRGASSRSSAAASSRAAPTASTRGGSMGSSSRGGGGGGRRR